MELDVLTPGTRGLLGAVLGPTGTGETGYAQNLPARSSWPLAGLRAGALRNRVRHRRPSARRPPAPPRRWLAGCPAAPAPTGAEVPDLLRDDPHRVWNGRDVAQILNGADINGLCARISHWGPQGNAAQDRPCHLHP